MSLPAINKRACAINLRMQVVTPYIISYASRSRSKSKFHPGAKNKRQTRSAGQPRRRACTAGCRHLKRQWLSLCRCEAFNCSGREECATCTWRTHLAGACVCVRGRDSARKPPINIYMPRHSKPGCSDADAPSSCASITIAREKKFCTVVTLDVPGRRGISKVDRWAAGGTET